LEWARQEARLALARDRSKGFGRSKPEAVVASWESCLSADPTCEEAASALIQIYAAQQRWSLVADTHERCRRALDELGLAVSPAMEEIHAGAVRETSPSPDRGAATPSPRSTAVLSREERKLVSMLFAELASPPGTTRPDPEDLREVIGGALVEAISQVESLGGTVTSVSGSGLAAIFGAPDAHEDDPERAVRAGYRIVSAIRSSAEKLTVRIGVESGPAVVGPIGVGGRVEYGAVGEVVAVAAALQSVARAGSVLVGPATRAATGERFEWGPSDELARPGGAKPLAAYYLERPKAHVLGHLGGRHLAGQAALVGRDAELAVLSDALRDAISGKGGDRCCGERAGPRQDAPRLGVPEAFHGLGRGGIGPSAALARGPRRLLRLVDSLRALPAVAVGLDRGGTRGGRGGAPPRTRPGDESGLRR
jgi:class 3 adenylate cyclase